MNPPSSGNSSTPSPSLVAIEDAAITWLTEREDGFSPAREREFAQWLRADPRHAATVARLEKTLRLLHELPQFRIEINTEFDRAAPVVPFPPASSEHSTARDRKRRTALRWAGVAVALAVSCFLGWRVLRSDREIRYTTTTAGYERARLDDGSTLQLNAASAVRVHFTKAERHVELEAGEAHFAVAHDTTRPFVVSVGDVSVRAVGTAFNVRSSAEGVEVTVVEGKVRVGQQGPDSSAAAAAPLVAAGERLFLPKQTPVPPVEKLSPATLNRALAWQGRLAEFADAPLAEVILRFNARNRMQLVLVDADLGTRRIGGTFAFDEPEAFARLLERDGEIVAERRSSDEILLRRAR